MTRIYLVRHAEAEGNLYRIAQGQDNSILTDRGWRQVAALERRFADIPIDAVYSSDLYRTCATASAIFRPKNLPLRKHRGLREICVGIWEQRTWGDIYRNDPQQMAWFSKEFTKWHVEGAETAAQVRDRVLKAVREIAAEQRGKTVAVFSHGYALRLLLATVQGYSLEEAGTTPHGDNTAVSLLEVQEDGTMKVLFRDDNSHLQTPEYLAGEKVSKRPHALEPGLWFAPLRLPEQAELLVELVGPCWAESGDSRPFDPEKLFAGAEKHVTLVGYLEEAPVGVVQLAAEGGIALACIRADQRKKGFGAQLIGQAVMHHRPLGAEILRAVVAENSPARVFFADYGFRPAASTEDGCVVLEKDIRFDPAYL